MERGRPVVVGLSPQKSSLEFPPELEEVLGHHSSVVLLVAVVASQVLTEELEEELTQELLVS